MDWLTLFFDGWSGIFRILAISGFAYAGLIVLLRLSGKRSLTKLNVFDFVITVALGSTLASILLSKDVDWSEGMAAFLMLIGLQWLVAYAALKSTLVRRALKSEPCMLLEHGKYMEAALREERVTRAEIDAVIRQAGFGDPSFIAWVVLESDGSFSVISENQAGSGRAMNSVSNWGG